MSSNVPISQSQVVAPTPQNTPHTQAPIGLGLSRPTVPDIREDKEPDDGEENDEAVASAGMMAGLVHGRLADLVGKSSGYIESLPVEVKKSIEGLKGLQIKQNELHSQYKMECLELEKKVRHAVLSILVCFDERRSRFFAFSTLHYKCRIMSVVEPSSAGRYSLLQKKSKLANSNRSRMTRTTLRFQRTLGPLPQSQSFGLLPCAIMFLCQKLLPTAMLPP